MCTCEWYSYSHCSCQYTTNAYRHRLKWRTKYSDTVTKMNDGLPSTPLT